MTTVQNNQCFVAIRCLVYNHEPYLRECLDGFIKQQTNFKFVAIVHDDASTDKSADIIREYEEKYPVGSAKYKKTDSLELRYANISNLIETVNGLLNDGLTISGLEKKGIISESSYRKYKEEYEKLRIIFDRRNLDEKVDNQTENNEAR